VLGWVRGQESDDALVGRDLLETFRGRPISPPVKEILDISVPEDMPYVAFFVVDDWVLGQHVREPRIWICVTGGRPRCGRSCWKAFRHESVIPLGAPSTNIF
jgi:hypothetical protein